MTTIVPHTSRAAGTILSASVYNADHLNHTANATRLNDGKVEVPSSSVDNAIARFNGAGGIAIQSSGAVIDDLGNMGLGTVTPLANLHIVVPPPQKTAIWAAHNEMTFSGSDTSSALAYTGSVVGSSSNHARGFNTIFTVNDSITFDLVAYNITHNGVPGSESGALIGGVVATAGGNAWGVDHHATVPALAPNGNLTQTTAFRMLLERNVLATSTGFDRGFVCENIGSAVGVGPAFASAGYTVGLQLTEHATHGNPLHYLYFRGSGGELNVLRAIRTGFTDVFLQTSGQGLRIKTADPGLSATANLIVEGTIISDIANGNITLGHTASSNTPFIDFNSSGNAVDYDVRIIASGGSGSAGTGVLGIEASSIVLGGDIRLVRDAANTLAQRNGTTAQKFSVYNTWTDASNYERGIFDWAATANVLTIGTQAGGTGTARAISILGNGTITLDSPSGAGQDFVVRTGGGGAANNNATLSFRANSGLVGYLGRISSQFGVFNGSAAMVLGFSTASMVQWFGTTSAFPALKRSNTVLQAQLADDSALAPLQGKLRTEANAVAGTPTATHTMIISDAGGTAYRVLCVV